MSFILNEEKINEFSEKLKKNYDQYFDFYRIRIKKEMPEYKYLTPRYDDSISAYTYFFGCMMDKAGLVSETIWKNMRKVKYQDPHILEVKNLLEKFPESPDCTERRRKTSKCPAANFLRGYSLQFRLSDAHSMFRAAHFFSRKIDELHIDSILDLSDHKKYENPKLLYYELWENIFSTIWPKTLSIAFRIMTENPEGVPKGDNRFWKYDIIKLGEIPIPVDFWVAFFVFKTGLMELDVDEEKLKIGTVLKRKINLLFKKIYEITRIPPIFLDPVIWETTRSNCRFGVCSNCFFKDNLRYDCVQSKKIKRKSKTNGGKQYFLCWNAKI